MQNISKYKDLYDEYWYKLYAYAFNIVRSKENAEDIIQEVFVDIWHRWDKINIEHPKAYLYQAVKFQCAKRLKAMDFNHVQLDHIEIALDLLDNNFLDSTKTKENLIQEIDSKANEILPERCLKVFKLRYYENLSYKEISQRLNISRSTVDNQLFKAIKLLRNSNINYDDIVTLSIILSITSTYQC